MTTYNPFAKQDPISEYNITAYVMVNSSHSMGPRVARLSSLYHLLAHCLDHVALNEIAILDLTGFLSTSRKRRWMTTQDTNELVHQFQIHSISPRQPLNQLHTDKNWIQLRTSARIIIIYGFHVYIRSLAPYVYRETEHELLLYLPRHKQIYWMVDPVKDPRQVLTHRRSAIRPYPIEEDYNGKVSVLALHVRNLMLNLPRQSQGKTGLTFRDDERIIAEVVPCGMDTASDQDTFPIQNHLLELEMSAYRIRVTIHIVPVLRDYCYFYEKIRSLTGARSHSLHDTTNIFSWIDDYLDLMPWLRAEPKYREIEVLDLVVDKEEPTKNYFHRIIVDEHTIVTFEDLLDRDDTRIARIRNRIAAQKYQQTTAIPLRRNKGMIFVKYNKSMVVKDDLAALKGTVTAVTKYDLGKKIDKIFTKFVKHTNQELLFTQLHAFMMELYPTQWQQLRKGIENYNRVLARDWHVQDVPTLGRWLLLMCLPAFLDEDRQDDEITDAYHRFEKYTSLIDRTHGLIAPSNYKFDRRKIIDTLAIDLCRPKREHTVLPAVNTVIPFRGKLYIQSHRKRQHILLLDEQNQDQYNWFTATTKFPGNAYPVVTWYPSEGAPGVVVDKMTAGDTEIYPCMIIRLNYQQYLYIIQDSRWELVGQINYRHRGGQFVFVELTVSAELSHINLDHIEPEIIRPRLSTDIAAESKIELFIARLSIGNEYCISLYESSDEEEPIIFEFYERNRDLLACLKQGKLIDDELAYDFHRFDLQFEGPGKEILARTFEKLLYLPNNLIDNILPFLPSISDIAMYIQSEGVLDFISRAQLSIIHLKKHCVITPLDPDDVGEAEYEKTAELRTYGYYHALCCGVSITDDNRELMELLIPDFLALGAQVINDKLLLPPHVISMLYFVPFQAFDSGWYEFTPIFNEKWKRVAQEDITMINILKEEENNTYLPLLKPGTYGIKGNIQVVSLELNGLLIRLNLKDIKTGNFWDISFSVSDSACALNDYLEGLQAEGETPIVDLFSKLEPYRKDLAFPDQTLDDFDDFQEAIVEEIGSHQENCDSGCDPDHIRVVDPGFDIEVVTDPDDPVSEDEDDSIYEVSVELYYDSSHGSHTEVVYSGYLPEMLDYFQSDLLRLEVDQRGRFSGVCDDISFTFKEGEYKFLLGEFADYYLKLGSSQQKVVKYLQYNALEKSLSVFLKLSNHLKDDIDLLEIFNYPLLFHDCCELTFCDNVVIKFVKQQLWHVGLCEDHIDLVDEVFDDWVVEWTPFTVPLRIDPTLGLGTLKSLKKALFRYLKRAERGMEDCIFETAKSGCDEKVILQARQRVFSHSPSVCVNHLETLIRLWLLEHLCSDRFKWESSQLMTSATRFWYRDIKQEKQVEEFTNYLLMALITNNCPLIYHFSAILGQVYSKKDYVIAQGLLLLATKYQGRYDPTISERLPPVQVYFKLALNYQIIGGTKINAHKQAIFFFDLALQAIDPTEEENEAWYQIHAYYLKSLIVLGEYSTVQSMVPEHEPNVRTSNSENAWLEILMGRIVTSLELYRLNGEVKFKNIVTTDILYLEEYLYSCKILEKENYNLFVKKLQKILTLKLRHLNLYGLKSEFQKVIQNELQRYRSGVNDTPVNYYLLLLYNNEILVNNMKLDIGMMNYFEKQLNNKVLSEANKMHYWWVFDYKFLLAFRKNYVLKFEQLLEIYYNASKEIDFQFTHRNQLLRYYVLLLNNTSHKVSPKILSILNKLYEQLEHYVEPDEILNPKIIPILRQDKELQEKINTTLFSFTMGDIILRHI